MMPDDRDALLKVLHAHAQTIAICEACAATTRDLATEVARGGLPARDDLVKTIDEAERVLGELTTATPSVTTAKETRYLEVDTKPLFVDAAAGMLDFFTAGKALVDRQETMAVMRILEASRDPAALERFVKL